ncbi:hypothetical protein Acsp06_43860 [Actinomycetospora sp. NBRC 106375]|uniref:hypothetical protein n=1 Tax=Actinomycetospora sp. NBRC 106375 TaxID=3032207 RepID=UPI0024A0F17C|nr:hypothetical protein [Actinomycetospora sp. NBRC 106375]GLZ48201.1 hypothetical protein Acsp06_43860 [Actinomycetospora sp. NBRC 106375]
MPAPLVTTTSAVVCTHGGQARATVPNPRVRVAGSPAILLPTPWTVAGCTLPPPPAAPPPCVSAVWTMGTLRVRSTNQPLVVQGGSGTCVPNGTPPVVMTAQPRVVAT